MEPNTYESTKVAKIVPVGFREDLDAMTLAIEDGLSKMRYGSSNEKAVKDIINTIHNAELIHPTMPASGAFSNIRNNFRDAQEMLDRGYPSKSILPTAKAVMGILASPVTEPARLLGRLISGYTPSYMTTEEMAKETDIKKLEKAIVEHLRDLYFEREDLAEDDWLDGEGVDRYDYIKARIPEIKVDESKVDKIFNSKNNDRSWNEIYADEAMRNTKGLHKIASTKSANLGWDVNLAKDKIEELLPTLKKGKDNKETIKRIADLLSYSENRTKSTLPDPGAFEGVKTNLKYARELLQRGYPLQSLEPIIDTGLNAIMAPITEPIRLLGRLSNGRTLSYMTPEDIANEDDVDKIRKAVKEHIDDLNTGMPDLISPYDTNGMRRLDYVGLHDTLPNRDLLNKMLDDKMYNKIK